MKTIFYAKSEDEIVTEPGTFELMKKRADALRETCEMQPDTQVVVVLTSNHNMYGTVIDHVMDSAHGCEHAFLQKLQDQHDTDIRQMVCMWPEGSLDVPSYDFRQMICHLHENNQNAELLLQGQDGYLRKTIAQTMPKSRNTL